MPKTIPDLEEKILRAAAALFLEKGYAGVTMNQVASAAGTSVGNLYNYCSAKKDLFIKGRRIWLESFYGEMDALSDEDPYQALENALVGMQHTLAQWGGLWEEFLAVMTRELDTQALAELKAELHREFKHLATSRIHALLLRVAPGNEYLEAMIAAPGNRLAAALLSLGKSLSVFYSGEIEDNSAFIRVYLRAICRRPLGAAYSIGKAEENHAI